MNENVKKKFHIVDWKLTRHILSSDCLTKQKGKRKERERKENYKDNFMKEQVLSER